MGAARTLLVSGGTIGGTVSVPGDKSISHRAAILASLARGTGEIAGFLDADDTNATLAALATIGVAIERPAPDVVRIEGRANAPFDNPAAPLDFGNSGTGLRLLAGVLAGRGTRATLTGDASLTARPMARIVEPLVRMGARIRATDGRAPLVLGGGALTGIDYRAEVASAQVASSIVLAGLHANGITRVTLPAPVRDHTQRLLGLYGIPSTAGVSRTDFARVPALRVRIPGDASQAAFVAAGAALIPGAEVTIPGVGANPHRTRFSRVLARMGARVRWQDVAERDGEPVGTLTVQGGALRAVDIQAAEVPALIDELPMLMVLAAFAEGTTTLDGAAELRYKESDRLETVAAGLEAIGVVVARHPSGLTVTGGGATGGTVDARGDHRVAMAFAMAGLRVPVRIEDAGAVRTSWPEFAADLRKAGLEIAWQ